MKTKKNSKQHRRILDFFKKFRTHHRLLVSFVAASFLLNVIFLILASQFQTSHFNRRLQSFQRGSVAEYDFVSNQDFTYIDADKTAELREKKAETILPVYIIDEGKVLYQISLFERFSSFFLSEGKKQTVDELYTQLSLRFPNWFNREEVEILSAAGDLSGFIPLVEEKLRQLLETGIFPYISNNNQDEEAILELWHWEDIDKVHEPYTGEEIVTLDGFSRRIGNIFSPYDVYEVSEAVGIMLLEKFIVQTAYYSPSLTNALRDEARENIEPIMVSIAKGDKIIRAGDIITQDNMRTIEALLNERPGVNIQEIFAIVIYTAAIFFLAYIMFAPLLAKSRRTFQHSCILLIASTVFTFNIFIVRVLALIPADLPLSTGVATALISMLIAILVSQRTAIISSLLFSLLFFTLPDIEIFSFMFSFFAGVTATYVIRNAEKRIDLVSGTLRLMVVMVFCMTVIGLFQQKDVSWYFSAGGAAVLYAFISGALNLSLLPALEHLLNAPTVFRLRELSDTNTPVFKRMITVAPGTYSHSMSVANLAESACREIDANHLLARVGAYYHDIGKMDQPDYFIENQQDKNKHDDLTPNLSVAVIKSHVKIGKEKAKELKLPPEVVEIVADHHGSDVIGYFYQQAVKSSREKVAPEEFSYNGIPPRSKESAVVMLADTIEAQSRTVKKPTVQKFEKMVWDTIMLKVGRKQLSNSVLSFQDMEKIKNSFVQILAGQFHNRIEYPDQKENG